MQNAAPAEFQGNLLPELVAVYNPGKGAGAGHALSRQWPFASATGATARFDVFFEPGFEWSCGGKLGGVQIGRGVSSGCRHSPNGASLRVMWQRNGGAIAYVYVPTGTAQPRELARKTKCGTALFATQFRNAFTTGTWHSVEMGVTLNTPGRRDGVAWLSIDGRRHALSGVTWRPSAAMGVTGFVLTTFHGGPCKASKRSVARFRNLAIG